MEGCSFNGKKKSQNLNKKIMKQFIFLIIILLNVQYAKSQNEVHMPADSIFAFMPELLSGFPNTRDMTISPDGKEMYFTVNDYKHRFGMIVQMQMMDNGYWSRPERASFSGKYPDIEPAFSPDGKRLYFASKRPIKSTDNQPKDYDIWYVERSANDKWSKPIRMDSIINTSNNEYYPSLSIAGNLYFTAERTDTKGKEDIYISHVKDGVYQTPISLSDSINTSNYEFNAFVDPHENFLIFSSQRPEEGKGGGDLYISRKRGGTWAKAELLEDLNSPYLDFCPFVDSNSGYLYFTSQRSHVKTFSSEAIELQDFLSFIQNNPSGLNRIYYTKWFFN
jgi:Tol biopolymer transport system component